MGMVRQRLTRPQPPSLFPSQNPTLYRVRPFGIFGWSVCSRGTRFICFKIKRSSSGYPLFYHVWAAATVPQSYIE